jgi:hypothetical protein
MIHKFSALLLIAVIAAGCKKDNAISTPSLAEFADLANANTGKYYVMDDPNSVFEIKVGTTVAAKSDRTIEFSVASPSGAQEGTHFTIPGNSVVIPAGSAVATIPVKGIFENLGGRKDTLIFTITGGDVDVWEKYNKYTLAMQQYCDVVLAELEGLYENTTETRSDGSNFYGPYPSSVTLEPIDGSSTTAKIIFHNFWDYSLDITGKLDWTDPANFKVEIPRQYLGLDYDDDQPIDVRTSAASPSTFSSCDQSFSLSVDFLINNYDNTGQTAILYSNYKIYIKR